MEGKKKKIVYNESYADRRLPFMEFATKELKNIPVFYGIVFPFLLSV